MTTMSNGGGSERESLIMNMKILITGISVLALVGCASTKKKEEVAPPPPPPQEQTPPPVETMPAPAEPVDQGPVVQAPITQPYTGPTPGSIDHFKYVTGGDTRVYFGYDRYDLTAQARDVLRQQADWLKQYNTFNIMIEGNADERGTREYNLALAARRAEATKAFLISQGIRPSRISTVSYGKERPIDPRSNEEAWAKNRNTNTVVIGAGPAS